MQRSILILSLSLTLVVVLTVLLLCNRPSPEQQAAKPVKADASAAVAAPDSPVSRRSPETVRALGVMAYQKGRYPLALDYFAEYRDRRPNRVESYTYLAIVQLSLDRPADAAATIADGLAKTEDTPQIRGPLYFVLACAQAHLGDDAQASENLTLAYARLGSPLLAATHNPWAKAVCASSAYKRIVEQEKAADDDFRPSAHNVNGALSPE